MDVTKEYVVYRTGYSHRELEWIEARVWDKYLKETPNTGCVFISRGHTISEATSLVELANKQKRLEEANNVRTVHHGESQGVGEDMDSRQAGMAEDARARHC